MRSCSDRLTVDGLQDSHGRTALAIIGHGYMGRIYQKACDGLIREKRCEPYYKFGLPELLPSLTLCAVADPLYGRDETADPRRYPSLEGILEQRAHCGLNAAVIASPIATHYDVAGRLIRNKIHTLTACTQSDPGGGRREGDT